MRARNRAEWHAARMTRTSPVLLSRVLATLVVPALLVAACGGDDGPGDEEARAALVDAGLDDAEIDCLIEESGLDLGELAAVEDAEAAEAAPELMEAMIGCIDLGAEIEEATDGAFDDAAEDGGTDLEEQADEAVQDAIDGMDLDDFDIGEPDAPFDGDCSTFEEPCTYGDDAELDALWDACEGGDGEACDTLYRDSAFGSEYEHFGNTCGGRGFEVTCADPG